MTRSRIEAAPIRQNTQHSTSIEAMADELIALIEEFEVTISEGRVPPAFASKLAKIRAKFEDPLGG